ncbi:YbfB/YjiJ family MFS transporter [uncultured Psychrobacter sp.]|uniref:YbfB/YjiJ family MFS transporter n=1 Tax=uncultured Psychrobacter sp. TaxID=259303 RepID=UPI0034590DF7
MTVSKSRRRSNPIITNETAIAFIGLYSIAVAMGYGRFLFTATLPDIMVQLPLTTLVAGWLASVNYIGYFIGSLVSMFIPQRLTWQTLMLGAIISVATTLLLFIPQLPMSLWYVIRLLAGIASGLVMILSTSFIIQRFSLARRSILSTIHYAGIGVGISASAIVTWWLLNLDLHFDTIWLVAGVSSLPLLWLLYAIRPLNNKKYQKTLATKVKSQPTINQIYKHFKRALYEAISAQGKAIALLSASYILAGFGYITSTTFLPVMAEQQLTGQSYIGLRIWLVVGICIVFSNPVWGLLSKRIGELNTLIGLTIVQALGMFAPTWLTGIPGLYVNAVIVGLTFAGMVSMTLNIIKNMNPDYSNLLIGLATLAYALGQFIGPLVTVALAGPNDNFNAGLLVAGIGLLLSVGLLVQFRKHWHPIE